MVNSRMNDDTGSMERLKELISYVEGMSAEQMQMHIIRTQVERSVRDLQLRDDEARIKADIAKKEAEAQKQAQREQRAQAMDTPYIWFLMNQIISYAPAWFQRNMGDPTGVQPWDEWLKDYSNVDPKIKNVLLGALDVWMTREFTERHEGQVLCKGIEH